MQRQSQRSDRLGADQVARLERRLRPIGSRHVHDAHTPVCIGHQQAAVPRRVHLHGRLQRLAHHLHRVGLPARNGQSARRPCRRGAGVARRKRRTDHAARGHLRTVRVSDRGPSTPVRDTAAMAMVACHRPWTASATSIPRLTRCTQPIERDRVAIQVGKETHAPEVSDLVPAETLRAGHLGDTGRC